MVWPLDIWDIMALGSMDFMEPTMVLLDTPDTLLVITTLERGRLTPSLRLRLMPTP